MTVWTDVDKMFQNMYDHVQITGDKILTSDNPLQYTIGFQAVASDKPTSLSIVREVMEVEFPKWEIGLSTIRSYNGKFREYLKTSTSRRQIALSIPNCNSGVNIIDPV